MSEIRATVRIVNPHGLHARPCHAVVSAALPFAGSEKMTARTGRYSV